VLDKLIDLLIACLELFRFWIVLDPYEQGVLLRLGRFVRVVDPGFHWILPFRIDHVVYECVVASTHSLGNESVVSTDGKSVGFHAVVTYQVRDIKKALLEIEDVNHAVRDACLGEIGRVLRESSWSEITDKDILDKLTAACRRRGFRYGIEIVSVQLASLSLVKNIRIMGDPSSRIGA
jgi:regulator of protease activity HflC (stomatin/prohibitin superfamily)